MDRDEVREANQAGDSRGKWRRRLKRVPGLAPGYRRLRRGWWLLRDALRHAGWRLRAALPLGGKAKGQVSSVWGQVAAERSSPVGERSMGWLDLEEVLWGYVFSRFGGKDWYQYLAERYCAEPREMGLSLCCGDGHVERDFLNYHICDAAEGMDISAEAIKICRREAAAAGLSERLTYWVADLEQTQLPRESYDVVVAWMALHHLSRLGHVFREVRLGLRPGGIFVVNEYVGPARFQMPSARLGVMNELLRELPDELRRMSGGEIKYRCDPAPLERMMQEDPSEGVSSERILPLLRRHFSVVEQIDYGGTLLMPLLSGIAQNFRPDNAEHRAWLEHLYAAERRVLESGEFPSDFAFVVARRPEDEGG